MRRRFEPGVCAWQPFAWAMMLLMVDLLIDEPLLLLAVVLALGGLLGSLRVRGVSLGAAGALVVGLVVSGLDDRLTIDPLVGTLGLSLFTFAVGLASGPSLVSSLRSNVALIVGVGVVLALAAALAAGLGTALGLDRGVTAGLYAGSLTNTPALAAATDALPAGEADQAVVGYAIAYLYGVIGMLIAVILVQANARRAPLAEDADRPGRLVTVTVRVSDDAAFATVGDLHRRYPGQARVSRIKHDDETHVGTRTSTFVAGDLVAIACDERIRDEVTDLLGTRTAISLTDDRSSMDFRRILVSRSGLVGRRIDDLDLETRYGATITRVRRSDVDLVATDAIVLEPGDRLRVVGPADALVSVAKELGDSERRVGEFQAPGFLVGLVIGLAIGLVEVPIPGLGGVRLGSAGGPLVVGLVLGHLQRTGPLVWQLPHGANLTLRQLGAILFLAVVGVSSGPVLVDALQTSVGPKVLLAGFVVTSTTAAALMLIGRLNGVGGDRLSGVIAGAQTQPAVLAFAVGRSEDARVPLGYALATPVAMVVKIVMAQVLVLVL
jgi:putative transport protein